MLKGYEITFSGVFIILLSFKICDSAVMMHSSLERKPLEESSPEYQISPQEGVPTDVCIFKSNRTNHYSWIPCKDVKGESFPLDLTEDKYLHLKKSNRYVPPGQYCTAKRKTAKLCPTSTSLASQPSLFTWRKCCPHNQLVQATNFNSCVASSVPFRLPINHKRSSFSVIKPYLAGFSCPAGFSLRKFTTDKCASQSMTRFRLSPNGTIEYETGTGVFLRKSVWKTVDPSSNPYCLDGVTYPASNCNNDATSPTFQQKQQRLVEDVEINDSGSWPISWDDDGGNTGSTIYSNNCNHYPNIGESGVANMTAVLFVCVQDAHISVEPSSDNILAKTTLLAFIWLLTCPLLLGAALGNSCIIQKNVHGWILTCYLLSMFVLNVLSAIVIVNVGRMSNDVKGCRLHKTFRYTLPQPVGIRRFIASVIFSLGFPAISVTLCYYVATRNIDQSCGELAYCVLFSPVTIPFYTVPMLVLVLGNFAIFLKTSYTITALRKEAEDVLQIQAQDHLKSFALFAKLFLLTGCIWLLRLVLFVLQIKGLYLSWYGVMLETVFSVPEVVFPMIVFHHPEFIKWCWNQIPLVSSLIFKFNPLFHVPNSK